MGRVLRSAQCLLLGASPVLVPTPPLIFVVNMCGGVVNSLRKSSSCQSCDFSTMILVSRFWLCFLFGLGGYGTNPKLPLKLA